MILVKRVVVLSSYSCFVREINLSMRSFDDIYWQNFSLKIQAQDRPIVSINDRLNYSSGDSLSFDSSGSALNLCMYHFFP